MKNLRSGSSLIAVLFSMMIVAVLVATMMNVTGFHTRMAQRTINRHAAIAYADGVIESLYDQWRQAMISVTNDTDRKNGLSTTALAAVLSEPSSGDLQLPPNVTLKAWSVIATTPLLTPTTRSDLRPEPENGTKSTLRVRLHYLASVTVGYFGPTGEAETTVRRSFVRGGKNLFDNFFFGTQQETEFHPGAPMYVDGTVYAGGSLWTAHDDLHFLKDVTYVGSHTNNYRPNDPRYPTPPTIPNGGYDDNWSSSNPPQAGTEQKLLDTPSTALDPNFIDDITSNDTDSEPTPNANNNGYHELIEEAVTSGPTAGEDPLKLDADTSERFAENADYRIYVDANNNVTIYAKNDTVPLTTTDPLAATALLSALTTNRAIRDVREANNVRLVTMDVDLIRQGVENGRIKDVVGGTDGLLLFVHDKSSGQSVNTRVVNSSTGAVQNVTSSRSRGVRLTNGARLPSNGLTVVSPNPVYIQGDFNSGKNGSTQPASNTTSSYTPPNDTPSPIVTGYDRAPSAVVGDAVNILSNGWNDANSLLSKANRRASNTTINTAIVAGNVPTTSGSYSGGIENFVRFHEDWSSRYYTIYGALAQLYASQQATRPWSAADYNPPNRRWYYDTLLQERNPPGFRVARVYERGRWTQR